MSTLGAAVEAAVEVSPQSRVSSRNLFFLGGKLGEGILNLAIEGPVI